MLPEGEYPNNDQRNELHSSGTNPHFALDRTDYSGYFAQTP